MANAPVEKPIRKDKMLVPVRSNRGNITIPLGPPHGELQLVAGPNLVPLEKWEVAREMNGVRVLLGERIPKSKAQEQDQKLVGRCVLEAREPVPARAPLGAMSETDAVAMVEDMVDQSVLERVITSESRNAVRRAIEARILELRDPTKAATAAEAAAGMGKATIEME